MTKVDLTVIIPVHSVADPNFKTYLDSALLSVSNNEVKPEKVLIVRCPCGDVREELAAMEFNYPDLNIEVVENSTGKSLQSQINFGVSQTTTKYFTFLEFDDELSNKWLKNVDIYTKAYPEVKMFLPIITDVNPEGKFLGYTNEAAWAKDFSEKQGVLDIETLLQYPNFNLSGMVADVEAFRVSGGYKASIKLTFNYELLLRFVEKGNQVMIIPKIGYKHVNMRPSGLFWAYKNDDNYKLSPEEAIFWMDVAKKEYFFTEDRNISYVK
jgi:hypothetical protein